MSGIEVGGIALAVFPILVDALVHFVDGVQTIKDWRRYRVRLDNYANLMETHKVFYLDTLEELLTDIVQFEDEITDLMANPRGAIWKKPEYEEKLRQRLGRSYNAYIQTLDKMRNALSEMCDKLGVDSSGKVLWDDYSRVEREMKRIKVILRKNTYKEALDVIGKANHDLREFTHQSIYLEPIRQRRRSRSTLTELKLIRTHATSLYRVLIAGKAWKCSCKIHYTASLRLESRPGAPDTVNADNTSKLRFGILLSSQERDNQMAISEWQEVEVVPSHDKKTPDAISVGEKISTRGVRFRLDQATTTTDFSQEPAIDHGCEPIVDFCHTLCASHKPKKAIGFILDGDDKQKHYLYRVDTTIGHETRPISLSDLLSYPGRGSPQYSFLRSDRLQIAVTLASSVLQLHGTSWLESQWSSKDIILHEKIIKASGPSYSNPYLSWKPCVAHSNVPSSSNPVLCGNDMTHSEVLFALGLTLVELCFGRTLAEMHVPEDSDPNEAIGRKKTAQRLLRSVYNEMGIPYGDAVRRCLSQPFDVRDMSFDNEEFQQKVFDEIVTPLSNDLSNFIGESRIK